MGAREEVLRRTDKQHAEDHSERSTVFIEVWKSRVDDSWPRSCLRLRLDPRGWLHLNGYLQYPSVVVCVTGF